MNSFAEVTVLVEGLTEKKFIDEVLAPFLSNNNTVFLTPILLSKPGQKGGDVRFVRAQNDIETHLKQRGSTYVTTLVDYYGIDQSWPGLRDIPQNSSPEEISAHLCSATQNAIDSKLGEYRSKERFIPNFAIHEFEAMLFSDPAILAKYLGQSEFKIDEIVRISGGAEAIDNSPQTAPSKRIASLMPEFRKTITGIEIAKAIGIPRMRLSCPVFDAWLKRLESLNYRSL